MFEPFLAIAGMKPSAAANLRRTGFNVENVIADDTVILRLQGELDLATGLQLRRRLDDAMAEDVAGLVLDLKDLTFVDSAGICILVSASRTAQDRNRSFTIRNPSRTVLKTLRLAGLERQLNISLAEHPAGTTIIRLS